MLICILLLMFFTAEVRSADPNPCSPNPSILIASDAPKHIGSPHENDLYLPNTDCQFLLRTTSPNNRIAITVLSSRLEEPLFGNCTDYVTARDGDRRSSGEIETWCGRRVPSQIIGAKDSLFLAFHTDGFVQSKGFNLTYQEFEFPGCPPGWVTQNDESTDDDDNERWCYWLGGTSGKGLSWAQAQHECAMSQANLAVFTSMEERDFVFEKFGKDETSEKAYWTSYNSIEEDGTFKSLDGSKLPDDFPKLATKHYTEDCVVIDFANGEPSYQPSDCRTKKPYICARRYGKAIIPAPGKAVRNGLEQASLDITYWILIIVVLILLLLLCFIAIGHCKDRFFGARVQPTEDNRLVSQAANNQVFSTTTSRHASSTHVTIEQSHAPNNTALGQHRPKSGRPIKGAELNNVPPTVPSHPVEEQHVQTPVETINETHRMHEMQPSTSGTRPDGIEEGRSALRNHDQMNLEVPQGYSARETENGALRLETELSLASSKYASNLANPESSKKMMFLRPKMSLLEHSSAISLDDFWKNI
ncbi:hypothetical protein QR680_001870 [Steinernema hermaphroditum]|uniref:CUB domain-containing protein n=1 Tax=Steinernema hermaphroditum TaxID=289476 RepID=A0AA39H080_9BILA|nr:hypothetical protein QR680_001870 [Steinernema hermaphroditum]